VKWFRERHIEADAARAIEIAMRRHRRFIRMVARRRSSGDPDFAKDLEQEAYIYMWELDPTRFDPAEAADMTYLQRALAEQIRRKMRVMHRQQPR
jgi:DNA-directed RNA polymerase specialized sigma24 family protein